MNKWKSLFFLSILVIVVCDAILIYIINDQRTAFGYMKLNYESELRAKQEVARLFLKTKDYSRKEVMDLLRETGTQANEYIELGTEGFLLHGVKFKFQNDQLIGIE